MAYVNSGALHVFRQVGGINVPRVSVWSVVKGELSRPQRTIQARSSRLMPRGPYRAISVACVRCPFGEQPLAGLPVADMPRNQIKSQQTSATRLHEATRCVSPLSRNLGVSKHNGCPITPSPHANFGKEQLGTGFGKVTSLETAMASMASRLSRRTFLCGKASRGRKRPSGRFV
jgi:hypothetical protein